MLAAFPLFLLTNEIRDELLDQLAARLPQPPQLVEHERGITGVGHPQPRLERVEHFLDTLRGPFLLLDAVLETIDLVLQLAVCLLELGSVTEQGEDAILLGGRRFLAKVELEKSELSQRLHEIRSEGSLQLTRRAHSTAASLVAQEKRWPRSTQYSSHLFSITLRAQR